MTRQMYGLAGKRALVTGGSRGIGLALAQRLVHEGAQVAICGRKEAKLEAARAQLGDDVLCVAAHVAKADQVDYLFEQVEERFAGIDVVINNVGMNLPTGPLAEVDPALWQKIIDSNLNGTFLVTRRAVQLMKRGSTGGAIVTVSSTAAH
ncbi:MAG: SDR family NAD(P)-dependent oxidoreductase, partial [Proteobacteria bacterium]|nr:SDR family NAD(P)-dependent oxidoreductase [Pseudomonadota bacterium]